MRKKMDEGLGNFEEQTIRVKEAIRNQKSHSKTKRNNKSLLFISVAALFSFAVIGTIFWNLAMANEPNQLAEKNEEKEIVTSYAIPEQKIIDIMRYELFYFDDNFHSEAATDYFALNEVINMYMLFYHYEKHNEEANFPSDRIAYYENRAKALFETKMEDAYFARYFKKINEEHQISEQDYIDYLYVLDKFSYLENELYKSNLGFVDGQYPYVDLEKEYEAVLGLEKQTYYAIYEQDKLSEFIDSSQLTQLPFPYYDELLTYQNRQYIPFGYNEAGELRVKKVVDGVGSSQELEAVVRSIVDFYIDESLSDEIRPLLPINRVTLREIQQLVNAYIDANENNQSAEFKESDYVQHANYFKALLDVVEQSHEVTLQKQLIVKK